MFVVDGLEKIKPTNKNTFAHGFFALYERHVLQDQHRANNHPIDRALLHIMWVAPNKIMETMNNCMPSASYIQKHGETAVLEYVGPSFHKCFRQTDVFKSGHLDMALYIIMANSDASTLYWQTLQEISKEVYNFVMKDEADWVSFIYKHTNELTIRT